MATIEAATDATIGKAHDAMDLRDLVTIIFTTSAIPSNPSTSIVDEVLESFTFVRDLGRCNVIVTFDGYIAREDGGETKFKSMRINAEEISKYMEYQDAVHELFRQRFGLVENLVSESYQDEFSIKRRTAATATIIKDRNPSTGATLTILKMGKRIGFALAIREALKHVHTPYILIHQHDWTFLHHVDFYQLIHAMDSLPSTLHYIGFQSRKSLKRKNRPNLPIPEPMDVAGIRVAPLYFWYDKPHLARTEHYRTFVFNHGRFQPGDFIEDTMGHAMLDDLKAQGIAAHAHYGTWSYVNPQDEQGATLRHVSGRHFRQVTFMRSKRPSKAKEMN